MSATANTGTSRPRPATGARITRTQRTAILKALADPKRFELLERIARSQCPLGCSEALSALAIAPATLSHHVKELQAAGLVDVHREGKFIYLSLRPGLLHQLAATLDGLVQPHCTQTSAPKPVD